MTKALITGWSTGTKTSGRCFEIGGSVGPMSTKLNPPDDYARRAVQASQEFTEYLRSLSRERRANPRGDLISALAQVVDGAERLTEGEATTP
jgi:cytochrome P450